jgi:DeoR family fructose operon transcriptional repressor
MIAAARRTVLLADHTKFGNDCLARFASLDEIDALVTDNRVDDDDAADMELAGIRVVRA